MKPVDDRPLSVLRTPIERTTDTATEPSSRRASSTRASYASTTLSELESTTEWIARHYDDRWARTTELTVATRTTSEALALPIATSRPRSKAWEHAVNRLTSRRHVRVAVAADELKIAEYYLHHIRSGFPHAQWNHPSWIPPPFVQEAASNYHAATEKYAQAVDMEARFRELHFAEPGVAHATANVGVRAKLFARGSIKSAYTGLALLAYAPLTALLRATAPAIKSPAYTEFTMKQTWRHNVLRRKLFKGAVVDVKRSFKRANDGLVCKRDMERAYQSSKIAMRAAVGQIPNEYRTLEQPLDIPLAFLELHR